MKSKNKTLTNLVYRHATTLIGAAFVFSSASASAADAYWNNTSLNWDTGTATWNDLADGTGTTGVWVDGNSAVFSAGTALTGTYLLTNGGVTVDNITQEEGKIKIQSGTLTLADTAMIIDTQTHVSGDYDLRIDSTIANSGAGASSITKNGAGMLMLTGNNTFSGGITLNAGTLNFESSATAFGSGTLTLNGGNLAKTWGSGTTIANAVNVTGTTNVGTVQGSPADFVFSGAFTGSGTFNVSNAAINGFNTVAASIKMQGDISGYTGTFAQTTGNNRLRFGPDAQGSTTINASQAKFLTSGSTSSGNPIDMADHAYGTFQMGELAGTGGIVRGGWGGTTAGGGTTTFEVGALNTSSQFAGLLANNLGTGAGASGGITALNKVGTGTLTLSGANTYTGATAVNAGTLQIGNGTSGSIASGSAVTVGASGTLALNLASGGIFGNSTITNDGVLSGISANPMTFSGAINGTGSLQKSGAGTLTLSGTSSYTGATTVSAGTLKVTGSIATSALTLGAATLTGNGTVGAVTVNNSSAVISNGNTGTGTLSLGSLAFSTGATLNLNKANDTFTPALAVAGNLSTTSAITVNVTTAPTWVSGQTYNLIGYDTLTGSASNFVKGSVLGLGARQSATIGSTGASSGYITLTIGGDSPYWTGATDNTWTTSVMAAPKNWKLVTGGTTTDFQANDQVLFDDNATGNTMVNISAADVHVAGVTFDNTSLDYTIFSTGGHGIADFSGPAPLIKTGDGIVTLTTTNSYTGQTTISAGTLQLGNGTTDGDIATSSNIVNDATLVFNRSGGSFTYSNVISGAGLMVKNGSGTQILTGANTYAGDTTINAGTLQVGNAGTAGSLGAGFITNDASLVFNRTDAVVQGTDFGYLDGTGSVTQAGSGTLTLSSSNSYSGGTTINAGTLALGNGSALGTGAITSNGGAIRNDAGITTSTNLTVNSATTLDVASGNWNFNGNISGNGNITRGTSATLSLYLGGDNSGYTGTFTVPNNGNAVVRFTSSSGGSENAKWVDNQGVNARTSLDFAGGTIKFGSFTGTGYFTSQGAAANTIEVGKLGLNETFSGVLNQAANPLAVTKVGTGTWTLSGMNTYTGATTVNAGTLALASTGAISATSPVSVAAGALFDTSAKTTFALAATQSVTFEINPAGAGSSGKIKAAALDITNASVAFTPTGTLDDAVYVIADYTSLTGTAFATVTPPTGYTINYSYNGGTQIALIKNVGYSSWATAKGLDSSNNGLLQDPNNNGIYNLMEYALNGDPLNGESPAAILPTQNSSGLNFVFDFHRLHDSASDTTQVFQYGGDLSGWTDVTIPASGTSGSVTVTADTPTTGIDHVLVTVSKSANTKLFGRLKVTQP